MYVLFRWDLGAGRWGCGGAGCSSMVSGYFRIVILSVFRRRLSHCGECYGKCSRSGGGRRCLR